MGRLIKLSEDEKLVLDKRIDQAREDRDTIREIRKKGHDAYHRRPLGNEKENRSSFISSDAYNHVESAHPRLMKQFLSADDKVKLTGPNMEIAKALKIQLQDDIKDQDGFVFLNDALKDGEIGDNGTGKVWWRRRYSDPEERRFENIEQSQVQLLEQNDLVQVKEVEPSGEFGQEELGPHGATGEMVTRPDPGRPLANVTADVKRLVESGPVIVNIPPEEFITARGKSRINDRRGCGHIKMTTIGEIKRDQERLSTPGNPYYKNLRAVAAAAGPDKDSKEELEKIERERILFENSPEEGNQVEPGDLRKEVELIEWYDYIVDGDRLVPAIVTLGNGQEMRTEENEDGIVSLITWSPIRISHSIIGKSLAHSQHDLQNARTMLTRGVLDSSAMSIDAPRMVRSRAADLLGLKNLWAGKLVMVNDFDAVRDIEVKTVDPRLFQTLEFLKAEGEERGPSTRQTMGVTGKSTPDTLGGMQMTEAAAFNKMDLIAMFFAETFLTDLYQKLIFLYQRNLEKPIVVNVDGKPVQLTRESIQGDYRARADLGMDLEFNEREFTKLQVLNGNMMAVSEKFPMLYPLRTIYRHQQRLYAAAGIKETDDYVAAPPPQLENWFPGASVLPPPTPDQDQPDNLSQGDADSAPDEVEVTG